MRRVVLALLAVGALLLLVGCTAPHPAVDNSTDTVESPEVTETEESSQSSRSSSVSLKSAYNPPCDPEEDRFLKVIELNGDGSYDESTEVVLENQLNSKAYVDYIAVHHGDVGTKTLVHKDFWIPGRGVEAFTVDVEPGEIDGVELSTEEPWADSVGCS